MGRIRSSYDSIDPYMDIVIEEYLKEGATTRSVAEVLLNKYNIKTTYKTIYMKLAKTDNEEVLEKMQEHKQKFLTTNSREFVENKVKRQIEQKKVTKLAKEYWKGDKDIICVLKCVFCGEILLIKERFYQDVFCKCGKNIIFLGTPNFLNCKVVYKSKHMNGLMLRSFDKWRD